MVDKHWSKKRLKYAAFSSYKIILASNSPRRQQFLKEIGLDYTVQTHPVEEIFPPNLKGAEIPDYLVRLKGSRIYSIGSKGIGHHSRYDCLE